MLAHGPVHLLHGYGPRRFLDDTLQMANVLCGHDHLVDALLFLDEIKAITRLHAQGLADLLGNRDLAFGRKGGAGHLLEPYKRYSPYLMVRRIACQWCHLSCGATR